MLKYWGSEEIIGKLAELRFYDTAALAKSVAMSESLQYNRHPVKTIAAYYHRINNGGAERVLCQLCGIWHAMGYKVIVLTDKAPSKDDYKLPSGTERIVIPDYTAVTPQAYYKRAAALQSIIHEYHIDAVVYHAWASHFLFWDLLAIKAAGAACLVHCHNFFPIGMMWMNSYGAFLEQYALADAVVTLSDTDYAFWKHCNDNVHATINPLPGDISTWHPKPFAATHKILWIGRLSPMPYLPLLAKVKTDL